MRQRQSGRQIFWRAAVAATSSLAMVSGLYPLAPASRRVAAEVAAFLRAGREVPSAT